MLSQTKKAAIGRRVQAPLRLDLFDRPRGQHGVEHRVVLTLLYVLVIAGAAIALAQKPSPRRSGP